MVAIPLVPGMFACFGLACCANNATYGSIGFIEGMVEKNLAGSE
jgi:hypothetical protein